MSLGKRVTWNNPVDGGGWGMRIRIKNPTSDPESMWWVPENTPDQVYVTDLFNALREDLR